MSYVTDPIGDMLTRIRNAQMINRSSCRVPYSRLKHQLCDVLKQEEWIAGVEVQGEDPKKELVITFADDKDSLTLKRVSKPGRRVYTGKSDTKPVLNGLGMAVLSTSQGLMTDQQARTKGIGGELLCTVS